MRAKNFMVCDTETIGVGPKAIVFDFAYVISTRKAVLLERSFLVREVLTNPKLMFSAIADKRWRESFGGKLFHHYIPGLHDGKLRLHSWRDIVETMRDDMRTYNVDVFAAYNLPFDSKALGKTQHLICDGGKVLEYKPDMLCLWDFACGALFNTQLYHDTAHRMGQEAGWITPANNVRTNAEKAYAYLTGDYGFIESHTALEDAQIETEILHRLLKKKMTIPYNNPNIGMPWQRAQQIKGRLV